MRLLIQRVSKSSVQVRNKVVGEIGVGLLVLVGIKDGDNADDARFLAEKLSKFRIMADGNGKMNISVKDLNAEVLAVSQFTLYADTSGGNRPSFIKAADPAVAKKIYEHFVDRLKSFDMRVETGSFGDYMKIDAKLDGPVTIIMESSNG
ncbi:D-tyrosyl-tRNA(Tyr) deacylase [Candidatus Woesebacteria bacterium RIFCSPLOWO2_01_FULL_39_23]|uniref:D-aminoacyl-tRNA deacylase n=1 Tax=Candidatus Woesebacteria bacterium RIFCSPHIGHO2_01_FULL_40_22 TaxID=1802499 RepID=A0A1F7YMZ5_9BACT|nr:MAG: D-tyrosyl-tRNA(Tyr) deacylase [Candidatus Woesebacteria bacterium RBG_16_40_11]OGM27915.1 MAG: D-tyrosyl-tRNA(Tyr) deacylase [Candidatus Woesebacteria bacterium RIFCSPHIGHO2_01_FULL_40_22]OGM61671.1 MAG: D-tyrosyl-tRNA(Tyr) deacylase [Candidatus Woesebacteria bacterium RIFCSPLOWO2_01_FULL_39_23]